MSFESKHGLPHCQHTIMQSEKPDYRHVGMPLVHTADTPPACVYITDFVVDVFYAIDPRSLMRYIIPIAAIDWPGSRFKSTTDTPRISKKDVGKLVNQWEESGEKQDSSLFENFRFIMDKVLEIRNRAPRRAAALVVAEFHIDNSDYDVFQFSHYIDMKVALGWSDTTEIDFDLLRQAASTFIHTKQLATKPEIDRFGYPADRRSTREWYPADEHRNTGILKNGYEHSEGWAVRSIPLADLLGYIRAPSELRDFSPDLYSMPFFTSRKYRNDRRVSI